MSDSWLALDSKVVIVTGGASGIGKHIVAGLRRVGAQVACLDLSVVDGPDPETGAHNYSVDVTDPASVASVVARVCADLGTPTTLVNNAGVNLPRLLVDVQGDRSDYELNTASFDFMFNVNVKGVFLMAQAVARHLVAAGSGTIINVTSEAGSEGSKGQSAYSASKAAVNGFTLSWAKELGPYGVRVVGIAPGILEPTGLRSPAYNDALAYTRGTTVDNLSPDYAKVIPIGRPGKLDEIADLVCYAASDRASYITGTTLTITGGKSRG
ncbi:sorbitol-6-phosphate dehydrogenase subunit [Micropruina sp.]|uniref:sorbitol-6-phosphate dehydrogenase subunit n=1 Tax=Micropruina sp. TaxID=2737536 RepID=UPI0039E28A45